MSEGCHGDVYGGINELYRVVWQRCCLVSVAHRIWCACDAVWRLAQLITQTYGYCLGVVQVRTR